MKTDIIVLSCEQTPYTLKCFQSIRKHTDSYNLVWVDNGSSPKSRNAVMEEVIRHPSFRILWQRENLGFVGGVNVALRAIMDVWRSDAPYVVLLNNDVEVTDGWLERMVGILDKDEHLGAVGPVTSECKSWQSFENVQQVVPIFQIPTGFQKMGTDERGQKLDYCYSDVYKLCNMVAFFCTVLRKEAFQKLGCLDADYEVGLGDDDDMCKRMKDAGMLCAVSLGSYVFHNHRTTFKQMYSFKETERLSASHKEVFRQKHGHDPKVEAL